ncbi:MAG TPA: hypothetical protein VIE43_18665 [Thermoanaerobaculia bacterium]|jgi:hypothetical protein|nr:hypothetical protein [Thermoanaerobaculia bacterium]
MIRYPVSPEGLRALIDAEAPGWLTDAEERTGRFRQEGRYEESSPNWSRVKPVYMRLQHGKCAYCERRLAAEDFGGAIEHDLEHYRPKGAVPPWPSAKIARDRRISYRFATGEAFPEGYYLLAYHVLNYATACKKCNSPLKSNYFPIAGERAQGDDPSQLRAELPFLLFPLGELDEDPEEILTFTGISPVPRVKRGVRWRRARVTIDFFELDQREELWRERAEKIVALFIALEMNRGGSERNQELAGRAIETLLSPASGHVNCGCAFRVLYQKDRTLAEEMARAAQSYLDSQS